MPQWAGSCWYELRYLDPTNENAFVDPAVEPTGWARAPTCDPTIRAASTCTSAASSTPCCTCCTPGSGTRCCTTSVTCRRRSRTPGCSTRATSWPPPTRTSARSTSTPSSVEERDGKYFYAGEPVTREWGKMGKSLKNGVSPDDMYESYGADTLRLYLMATGPAGRVAAMGNPRRDRHVPVPAAAVAQRRRRGDRRADRRRRAARRRHDTRSAAPHDRRRARPRWMRCGSTPRSPS